MSGVNYILIVCMLVVLIQARGKAGAGWLADHPEF